MLLFYLVHLQIWILLSSLRGSCTGPCDGSGWCDYLECVAEQLQVY